MRTAALISQKGGSGKTTLAINLAVAAQRRGQAAIVVDVDPQASAAKWADSREADTPVVVSAQAARLPEVLERAQEHGAKLCLIDTAPHAESPALAAARAADLALIPCRPSILDLRAVEASRDISELAGIPAVAVLTAIPAQGPLGEDAANALVARKFDLAPVRIGVRNAFIHAMTNGLGVQEQDPRGKGADEIARLDAWLARRLREIARAGQGANARG